MKTSLPPAAPPRYTNDMNRKLLVVYASRYGQTEKIARRIAAVAQTEGIAAEAVAVEKAVLGDCSDVVVAGSVYFGRHARRLVRFVRRNLGALGKRHAAFVSVCGSLELAQSFLVRFARETGWLPDVAVTFAGATPYTRYGWLVRLIVRRAAAAEHRGDTDTSRDYEYTDWAAVDAFAHKFIAEAQSRVA